MHWPGRLVLYRIRFQQFDEIAAGHPSSNAAERVTVPAALVNAPGSSSIAMKTSSGIGDAYRIPHVKAGRNPKRG
jgi:hypothetical protein